MTLSSLDDLLARAKYYAKLHHHEVLTHDHLMMALVERKDVQDLLERGGINPVEELTRFHNMPLLMQAKDLASAAILEDDELRSSFQVAGFLSRDGTLKQEIDASIQKAIEKKRSESLATDPATGAKVFAPWTFDTILTQLLDSRLIRGGFQDKNIDSNHVELCLNTCEARLNEQLAQIRHQDNPGETASLLSETVENLIARTKQEIKERNAEDHSPILLVKNLLADAEAGRAQGFFPGVGVVSSTPLKILVSPPYKFGEEQCARIVWAMVNEGKQKNRLAKGRGTSKYTELQLAADSPLRLFCRDFTEEAAAGKLDPVIDRDEVMDRAIHVLCQRTIPNPVLTGEPGVGKTAIVEGLAQRIFDGDVPDALKSKHIFAINLNSLVAGTTFRGQFEERLKSLEKEIINKKDNIIIYIDELHTLVGAGSAQGSLDAANILKPALSRGEIQVIGSTTLNEYRKYIEKDEALGRRFEIVKVPEPNEVSTLKMVNGLMPKFEKFHKNTKLPEELRQIIVEGSRRWFPKEKANPDRSIKLADAVITRAQLRIEKARDKGEILDNIVLIEDWYEEVYQRIHKHIEEMDAEDRESTPKIQEALDKEVKFQSEATGSIARAIQRRRTGVGDERKPVGSFLFLGDSGVGKTLTAKVIAKYEYGATEEEFDDDSIIRIDCTELQEKHSVSKLIGSPPGYVGYDDAGMLEKLRQNPYSVVLFDEIEKAHPDVFNILLQAMDDGVVHNSKGRPIDFSKCILIMTSNALRHRDIKDHGFKTLPDSIKHAKELTEDMLKTLIAGGFLPEFLGRTSEIVIYNTLTKEQLGEILLLSIEGFKARPALRNLKTIAVDKDVLDYLKKKGIEMFGARFYKRAADRILGDIFSDAIVRNRKEPDSDQSLNPKVPTRVDLSIKDGKISAIFTKLASPDQQLPPAPTPEQDNTPPLLPLPNVA